MNLKKVPFEPESLVSGTFIWVLREFVKEGLPIINGPGQQLPVPMNFSPGIGHSSASDKEENVSSDCPLFPVPVNSLNKWKSKH